MDISQVSFASTDGPGRVAVYSDEGWGKTTLLCHFPRPIVVGAEQGIPRDLGFPVAMMNPITWVNVFDIVGSLTNDQHDYETLGFDTVDWLEPLIYRFILERDSKRQTEMNPKGRLLESIEDYGFGKGFIAAEEEFRKLISALDVLQHKRRMNVVMLLHSKVKTFKNPSGPDYDRWEPKTHERISRVIIEWAENVIFGYFEINASKNPDDKERHKMAPDKARAKGFGDGTRLIGTQKNALYDAKNRVRLPAEMTLGDPKELVPLLLGKHIAPVESRPALVIPWQGLPRTDERDPTDTGRMHSSAQLAQQQATQVPPPGVPAHHDSRREDEERRKNEALAKAKEANQWTEPKKPAPVQQPAARTPEQDLMGRLTQTITDAARLGPDFRKRVEGWVTKANGDPSKIAAIIGKVDADLAAASNNQPRA